MYADGSAFNIRPFPDPLRAALRELATAAGEDLYRYAQRVLREHVEAQQPSEAPDVTRTSG